MTIRPGGNWGEVAAAPSTTTWCADESELASRLATAGPGDIFGLLAGDVHTILGRSPRTIKVTLDVVEVSFVRHRSARRESIACLSWLMLGSWQRSDPVVVLSNTGYVDTREWFTKSHPNDGRAEMAEISAEMSRRQRFMTLRRLHTGLSITHPLVSSRVVTTWEWSGKPSRLVVDGRHCGRVTEVSVAVKADALAVYVGKPSLPAER